MATCYAGDVVFNDEVFSLRGKREVAGMWRMLCAATEARVTSQRTQLDSWDPGKAMKKDELVAAQQVLATLLPAAPPMAEDLLREMQILGRSVGIAEIWERPPQEATDEKDDAQAFLKKLQAKATPTPRRVSTTPSVTLDLVLESDVRTVVALLEKIRARRQWAEVTRVEFTAAGEKPLARMTLTFHYRSAGGT